MCIPHDDATRRSNFEAMFEKIQGELIQHFVAQGMPDDSEAIRWYRDVSPTNL